MPVSCTIITQLVCTNDMEEEVLFGAKAFTLQWVTIILRGTVDEVPAYLNMPSIYTINVIHVHANILS
jgi:hypothetical protein